MANKKQTKIQTIDFDNFQKEDAMMDGPLHMGETKQYEDGSDLQARIAKRRKNPRVRTLVAAQKRG